MDLFLTNGHVSSDVLKELISGNLDENQRLLLSEHLSFCDDCLFLYTELLTDDVCISPDKTLAEPVMKKIRNQVIHIITSRYTVAAASVLLALVLWNTGLFTAIIPDEEKSSNSSQAFIEATGTVISTFSNSLGDFFSNVSEGLTKVYWEPQNIVKE